MVILAWRLFDFREIPINDNQWHNIIVAFDRDDIASIYIDGVLDGQNQISSHPGNLDNNETLKVGGQSDKFLNGLINNLIIWDIELSLDQVNQFIGDSSSLNDLNKLADWRFNSGFNDIAYDFSGSANHGTIYGANWELEGCTDPLAENFDSLATYDDGSMHWISS